MFFSSTRLSVVALGHRLVVAALRGDEAEVFEVEAENPALALRAELDARKIPARTVALGLSRNSVSVKPIPLPAVEGDVRDMVRFELERHLPFPSDDAAFDFVPLPEGQGDSTPDGGRTVLVAAADARLVDSTIRLAQDARLRPISLTVAAHDLVTLVRPPRKRRVVWVHRAGELTDLLLLAGGGMVLSRSVPGADDSALADEIRRSLTVMRWRTCDAVWVSGDTAGPLGPTAVALSWLGAPVTAPPYTDRARRRLAKLPAESRGAFELAVAVAAARSARPLDLIPSSLRPRRITRSQALTAAAILLTVLVGVGALLAPGYRESRGLAAINREIARLDPEVRSVDRVVRELERKRKLLGTIDSLGTSALRPLPVLRELTEIVPADAWLTTLSLDTKGIELTGQAAAASGLIPLIENSPRFERAEFSSPVTRGRDREQFRLRATWEPGGASSTAAPSATSAPPPAADGARPTAPGRARGAGADADGAPGAESPAQGRRLPPPTRAPSGARP